MVLRLQCQRYRGVCSFLLLLSTITQYAFGNSNPQNVRDRARVEASIRAAAFATAMAASAVGQPLLTHTVWAAAPYATSIEKELRTVEAAAAFITSHCSAMLQAARSTGRLLYRGEPAFLSTATASTRQKNIATEGQLTMGLPAALAALMIQTPLLLSSPPDLADPRTYGPAAADYFAAVSDAMEAQQLMADTLSQHQQQHPQQLQSLPPVFVSPRTGHLATPDPVAASRWGPVVSIWPLDLLRYAVVGPAETTWWRDDWAELRGPRGPSFWRDPPALATFLATQVHRHGPHTLRTPVAGHASHLFTPTFITWTGTHSGAR